MKYLGEFRIILQEEGFPSISYELLQEHSDVKLVIYAETEGKIIPFTYDLRLIFYYNKQRIIAAYYMCIGLQMCIIFLHIY